MPTRIRFAQLKELLLKPDPPEGVLSEKAFRRVLDRECSRADRVGHSFALLLYEFRDQTGPVRPSSSVLSQIARRVRTSDQAGIFESTRVGIILPETDGSGARILAEDMLAHLKPGGVQVGYTVLTYPTLWDDRQMPGNSRTLPNQGRDKNSDYSLFNKCTSSHLGSVSPPFIHSSLCRRALDIGLSLIALVLLSPLMLFVSLLIFIVSPGPVIFKQPRVGFLYKPFTILKFRTMRPGCDEALHRKYVSGLIDAGQPLRKLDSYKDPRLIPFGAMLRRCFLDELPQLINVLRGQMSLVGPRPCLPYEAEKLLSWQKRRFYALPGMTGPWQVNGKESATYLQMLRYDVQYAHTASTFVNLKILLKTIPAVMGRFHKNGFRNSMRLKPSLTNFSRHT